MASADTTRAKKSLRQELNLKIAGTGSFLPEKTLSNLDLEKMVETNDAWIVERTGIRQRHIANPEHATSDLALVAAQRALEMAQTDPKELDMIIVGTATADQPLPSTAAVLQDRLGARNVFSFDLSAACTGFIYSLSIANQYIKTGARKKILVVGAETLSRIVNFKDRETCILFGDGAGAVVVEPSNDGAKILSEHLYADGALNYLLEIPGGGSRIPISQRVLDENLQYVRMRGKEIFKNAVRTMAMCCNEALETNKLSIEDIDWIVPHQANLRIIEALAKNVGVPMSKVVVNVDRTGNTSAATVPIALDEAVRDGRIKRGQLVLVAAFGAGLTSGSILLRF